MNSISSATQRENIKFWDLRFSTIRHIIDKIHLNLSIRTRRKELRHFQMALNDINSLFLNRYGYKYGYVIPGILADINLEVLERLKNKSKSEIDDFKFKVTAKGLTYLIIYQTCINLMTSHRDINSSGDKPYSETLLDLIQFSLDGLNQEKHKEILVKQ